MKEQNVFIGNCSKKGIYHYKLKKGKLIKKYETNDFERCTYLTMNKLYLYSVIEIQGNGIENHGYIISYKKDGDKLIQIDKKSSFGQGPCHIEIDEKQKLIFTSNYINGYFTVFKMNNDGTIGKKIYCKVENKEKSHVHCAKSSIDNKFFFVADLGEDTIIAYEKRKDEIKEIAKIKLENGDEPRHIVVSKNQIYVVTEKSCQLYIMEFINKKFKIIDKISILPKDIMIKGNYTGCAIKISKDFKYIYVTIRGHNSISVYKVGRKKVKMIQNISCKGNTPRDLEIDTTGKYILVANQSSNEIAIFKRNRVTGKIKYKHKEEMDSPTCVIIE